MRIEEIAKLCHESNRVYCALIGDYSQFPWCGAADHVKLSAIQGVEFRLKNPHCTPQDLHDAWVEVKTAAGWIYGPEKDEVRKTHPCIVPYDDLPPYQKVKDKLFMGIVDACRSEFLLCNWCVNPYYPDPRHHPGGCAEHWAKAHPV